MRNIWGALVRVQNVTSGVGHDGHLISVEDGEERRRLPFSGTLSQRIRQEVWASAVGKWHMQPLSSTESLESGKRNEDNIAKSLPGMLRMYSLNTLVVVRRGLVARTRTPFVMDSPDRVVAPKNYYDRVG